MTNVKEQSLREKTTAAVRELERRVLPALREHIRQRDVAESAYRAVNELKERYEQELTTLRKDIQELRAKVNQELSSGTDPGYLTAAIREKTDRISILDDWLKQEDGLNLKRIAVNQAREALAKETTRQLIEAMGPFQAKVDSVAAELMEHLTAWQEAASAFSRSLNTSCDCRPLSVNESNLRFHISI